MSAVKTRSVAIDLVRVAAIVAVVMRHTYYNPDGIVAQIVCPWAIAVFFVLTGYLWSYKRKTVRDEVKARWKGLLVPYAAWMILISVPYFIWAFQHYETWWAVQLFLGAGYGGKFAVLPFSACWFFTTMFFATIFMRFLERYPRWVTWAAMAAMLLVTVTVPVVLKYGIWGSTLAFPCMLFIVFGQELRRLRPRITRPMATGLGLVGIGTVAVLLGASHNSDGVLIEIKNSTYGYPVAGLVSGALIGVGLVLIAEALDKYIPPKAGPAVTQTAATATFIMFLHPCLILVLGTSIDGNFRDFLIALFVPYFLALACLRYGKLPWLTGVWPVKQSTDDGMAHSLPEGAKP